MKRKAKAGIHRIVAAAIKAIKTLTGIFPPSVQSVLEDKDVKRILIKEWNADSALTMCSTFNDESTLAATIDPHKACAIAKEAVEKAKEEDAKIDSGDKKQ